ncbi:hypothetical protein B0H14DRAFT_2670621 [Mycena olivaceomarginata]|nr:hypothetical protein B0H14DRAFT_2670621 [Mycena olivaceomarginata]
MQIGSSPDQPTYVFGDINKDSLVVDAQSVAGAALKLSPMDSSSQSQRWQIDCQKCYPDVAANPGAPGAGQLAEGCTVMQVSSDYCAEMMSGTSAPIGVTSCSGSSLQTFDFWPAVKTEMGSPDSPSSHWQPSHSSSSSTPSPSSSSSSGGTCAPDVGGLGVSIIAGSKEWGVSAAVSGTALRSDLGKLPLDKTAEWRVKQLGSVQGPYPPKYIFEEIGHTDLVVNALGAGGGMPVLTLSPFDTSSETQIWHVECHECESNKVLIEGGGLMGRGCTINLLGSGLCAQIESGTTASIGLASCSKAAAQTFDFYHTIPAASVPSGPQPSSPGAGSSPSCSSGPSCASSCPHVASGNLLSGALSSDNSAGFNYAPVIIGILSTNLLILLVLLCLGVMNFIRNGKKAGLTRNYVPVKMKDTDAFLAPPFEDEKRYSDS